LLWACSGLLACGGGGSGGGSADGITPLPDDTFLFVRGDWADGPEKVYAYDLDTRTERLFITDSDFDPSLFNYSISPDRRWVVFGNVIYKFDEDDARAYAQDHLWKVSADGKRWVRLTHPVFPGDESCPVGKQACYRERYSPVFSRDGKTLIYSLGFLWNPRLEACKTSADCSGGGGVCSLGYCTGPQMDGGSGLAEIPSEGGVDDPAGQFNLCGFSEPMAVSHDGGKILLASEICMGDGPGMYLKDYPLDGEKAKFLCRSDGGAGSSAVWLLDDSGFLYDNYTRRLENGQLVAAGECLYRYDFASGSSTAALCPPEGTGLTQEDGFRILGFSPSADQSKVVLSIEHPTRVANLYLLDMKTGNLDQLTSGGDDRNPVWHP
jgi:hypothetical protein